MQLPSPLGQSPSLPAPTRDQSFNGSSIFFLVGPPISAQPGEINPVALQYPVLDSRRYGCVPDWNGAVGTNNAIPLSNWLASCVALRGKGFLYPGSYWYNSGITVTVGSVGGPLSSTEIEGVRNGSVLVPGSGVVGFAFRVKTNTNSEGYIDPITIRGIRIDGNPGGTNGVIGLSVANDAGLTEGNMVFENVEVLGFHGVNGCALKFGNVVTGMFRDCYFAKSTVNLIVDGVDAGFPTTVTFDKCAFREADTIGVVPISGDGIVFRDCVFEANTQEAIRAIPGAGKILRLVFEGKNWFEANHLALPGTFDVFIDGTAATYVSVTTGGDFFLNSAAGAPLGWYSKNAQVHLDNVFANYNGCIKLDTGTSGTLGMMLNHIVNNWEVACTLDSDFSKMVILEARRKGWQAIGLLNAWANAAGGPAASWFFDVNRVVRLTGYVSHAAVAAGFAFASLPSDDFGRVMAPIKTKYIWCVANITTAPINVLVMVRAGNNDLFLLSSGGVNVSEIYFDISYRLDV